MELFIQSKQKSFLCVLEGAIRRKQASVMSEWFNLVYIFTDIKAAL